MIAGIIICHGNLASELTRTVQTFMGEPGALYPFSNEGLSPEKLYENIVQVIQQESFEDLLFMVDLRGGNCWKMAKILQREYSQARVISGINIPMLVSFITKRDQLSLEALSEIIETDAHRGVVLE